MRKHKYRVWDRDKKQMFPVSEISFGDDGSGLTVIVQPAPKPKYHRCLVVGENCDLLEYTGLKDCKGVEICEDDIIRIVGNATTAKVVFWERPPEFGLDFSHDEVAWCEDWNLSDDCDRMEIVGNVYENPELLEGKAMVIKGSEED